MARPHLLTNLAGLSVGCLWGSCRFGGVPFSCVTLEELV